MSTFKSLLESSERYSMYQFDTSYPDMKEKTIGIIFKISSSFRIEGVYDGVFPDVQNVSENDFTDPSAFKRKYGITSPSHIMYQLKDSKDYRNFSFVEEFDSLNELNAFIKKYKPFVYK